MNLRLENRPLKVKRSFEYAFENKQAKIVIPKSSILLPIFEARSDVQIGWLLEGPLGIIADMIVHSKDGAVGKIVDESYSHALIMPAQQDFIEPDRIKDVDPLEDTTTHASIIAFYNKKIVNVDFVFNSRSKTFIWCHDPFSMWLIAEKGSIRIAMPEILGRTDDHKLFWVSKKGITIVNAKGKSFNTSELFSGRKVREFVANLVGKMNVDKFMQNFSNTRYSIRY